MLRQLRLGPSILWRNNRLARGREPELGSDVKIADEHVLAIGRYWTPLQARSRTALFFAVTGLK